MLILYGALSPDQGALPVMEVLGRHLTIRGYELFEVTTDVRKLTMVKQFVVDGLASGSFRPQIAKVFPFEQIVEAHRYLESNAQVGKVVVSL